MGFPPMHVPFWQVSVCVQALLSLQEAVLLGCEQVPLLQMLSVQGLLSLQSGGLQATEVLQMQSPAQSSGLLGLQEKEGAHCCPCSHVPPHVG